MHTKGLVDAWRTGMVMSKKELSPILRTALEHAVWSSLYEGTRPRTLATRPHMRRALNTSRADLILSGALRPRWLWAIQRLLGVALVAISAAVVIAGWGWAAAAVAAVAGVALWFAPRRTIADRRALVAAQQRYPMPTSQGEAQLPPETVGMAVALYGDTALLAIVGRFATQGGLLDRRTTNGELGDAPGTSNPASNGY